MDFNQTRSSRNSGTRVRARRASAMDLIRSSPFVRVSDRTVSRSPRIDPEILYRDHRNDESPARQRIGVCDFPTKRGRSNVLADLSTRSQEISTSFPRAFFARIRGSLWRRCASRDDASLSSDRFFRWRANRVSLTRKKGHSFSVSFFFHEYT